MEDYKQHYQLSKDKKCGLMRIRPILEKQLLLDKVRVCFEKNSHIFTRQELDKIYGASGQYRRIRLLVFILQQKSILQLQAMQDLLEKNGLQGLSDLLRRLDDSKHNFFGVVADQSMSPDNRGHLYRLRPQLEKSLYLESYISQLHQHAEHGFLTDDEESRIMKHNTPLAQACQFMQILVKKGNKSYHGFMDVLKQNHITLPGTDVMTSKPARKLSRGRKSSSSIAVPLTDARKKALGSFECFTLEVLCFISSLHEAAGGFLSYDEEEDVVQQPSEPERVRKLIDIMKRRDSSVVYEHFIHVLKQSGMASDANILLDWERINNAPGSSMHNLPEAHDLIDQYIDLKCDFVAVLKESDRALWPRVKDYVVDRLMATSSTSSKNSSVLDSFADAEIENGSRILFFTLNNWFGFKLLLLIFNRFHSEFRMVVYKLDQYKEKLKPLMDSKLSQVEQIRCIYEEEASTPEGCERVIMRLGLDHKEMTVSGLLEAKDFIARELHLCTTALDEFKWAQSSILFCFTITSTLASPIEERLQDPTVQHNLSEELSIDLILVGQKGMVIRSTQSNTTKEDIGRAIYMAAKKKCSDCGFQEFIIDCEDAKKFFTKALIHVAQTYAVDKTFTFHITATNEKAVKREWEQQREAEKHVHANKIQMGAIIGSVLLPVLGTVIGAGVGHLVGKKSRSADSLPQVDTCHLTLTISEAINALPNCTVFGDFVYF